MIGGSLQEREPPPRAERPKAGPVRTGWTVFLTLLVGVIVEYVVAIYMDRNLPLMIAMNIADAALIIYYFMHVTRLWRRQEGE